MHAARVFLLVLGVAFCCQDAPADITKLSPATRTLLRDTQLFTPAGSPAALPRSVRAVAADDSGRLAAPNDRFEAGDAIVEDHLPTSRLLWAARSRDGQLYLLHYERGGRACIAYVALIGFDPRSGRAKIRWSAAGQRFRNHSEFARALAGKTQLIDHAPAVTH